MDEKRELTEKEKNRLEKVNKIIDDYKKDGYEKVDLTVSTTKANAFALVMAAPLMIIFIALYFIIYGKSGIPDSEIGMNGLWLILGFVVSIVVHELIHGITFSIFAKNHWKDIDFGMVWVTLTPYCTCISPVRKGGYLLALLMPCITLGIIPSIVAVAIKSMPLLIYGLLMILAAGGDLLICYLIIKNKTKKKDVIYLDHPTECGVLRFEK